MPTVRLALPAVVAALALAAPASAAQFYVDDNGAGPPTPGCQDQGHPCSTINAALTASRALAGTGDTHQRGRRDLRRGRRRRPARRQRPDDRRHGHRASAR